VDRVSFLQSLIDIAGMGLEIGPSYNPVVSKASGARVEVVDHASTEQIRAKYRDVPGVNADRIEDVDFVIDGGRRLRDVVGKPSFYDYVIASHVIEHTPDMISFLQDCDCLLKAGGHLLLAIPDKRYCFDVYRPISTTGDVLQAFVEGRTRHPAGKAFDHVSSLAILTAQGERTLQNSVAAAYDLFKLVQNSSDYHDIHAWQYTPSSFRLIVQDLNALGLLQLREVEFRDTVGPEFYFVLSSNGTGSGLSRQELVERSLKETSVSSIFGGPVS